MPKICSRGALNGPELGLQTRYDSFGTQLLQKIPWGMYILILGVIGAFSTDQIHFPWKIEYQKNDARNALNGRFSAKNRPIFKILSEIDKTHRNTHLVQKSAHLKHFWSFYGHLGSVHITGIFTITITNTNNFIGQILRTAILLAKHCLALFRICLNLYRICPNCL